MVIRIFASLSTLVMEWKEESNTLEIMVPSKRTWFTSFLAVRKESQELTTSRDMCSTPNVLPSQESNLLDYPGCHVEKQNSPKNASARDYCKKDDDYIEWGEFRPSSRDKKESTIKSGREDKKRKIYTILQEGQSVKQVIQQYPEECIFIDHILKYGKGRQMEEANVLYIYGPSGGGKTTTSLKVLDKLNLRYTKHHPEINGGMATQENLWLFLMNSAVASHSPY